MNVTAEGNVNVNIGTSYSTAKVAHEFKHAFQFDSRALSFDSSGQRGGALYDLVDEFVFQKLFVLLWCQGK
ncbi:hypothetical protein ACG2LH_16580 [Zhouia sp. PK063]|uniref:hypothetical protein n=1 Tax=Zhouia sp. PK063 TaxID=3373602 RepID=UPI0037A8F671